MRIAAWIVVVLFSLPPSTLAAPRWSADEDRLRVRELARGSHAEAMDQLKHVLQMHGAKMDPDVRGEALFRLADLQWAESRYLLEEAMADLDERYERWLDLPPEQQTPQTEPTLDDAEVRRWVRRAGETWRSLATNQPNHARAPEAQFLLSMCLDQLEQPGPARELREQFVARWPDHPLVAEALTGIGEYWFWNDNPYKALPIYRRAAEHTESRSHPLVLFRIAWCLAQVGQTEDAKEAFVAVLEQAARDRAAQRRGAFDLQDESLAALAGLYAETGDVEGARAVFCRLDPDRCRQHLAAVGVGLLDIGETDRAIEVWRRLIEDAPLAPDNPSLHGRVISALWSSQRFDQATEATAELADRYGSDSRWARANGGDTTLRGEVTALVEVHLRQTATRVHRAALTDRSEHLLALAERSYARYLELYPATEAAYELRFWHAEALFKLGRYDRAADEYERVVAADPDGRYLAEAAEGSIYAIEKHLEQLGIDVP